MRKEIWMWAPETKIVQAFVARTNAAPKVWMQLKNLQYLGLQVPGPAPVNRYMKTAKKNYASMKKIELGHLTCYQFLVTLF